jgi:hypothetical protein
MELGALKPVLAGLALPPVSLLLLALLGLVLAWCNRKRSGLTLATVSVLLLAVLSCHGTAVWLARTALPQFAPLNLPDLKARKVQAIVILGGDVLPEAPEYGRSQPAAATAARLRYGAWLARQSGLPLACQARAPQGSPPGRTARRRARPVRRKRLRRHALRGSGRARRRVQGHPVPLLPEQGRTVQGRGAREHLRPLRRMERGVRDLRGHHAEMVRYCMRIWWERIGATRASGITKLMISEARNFPELAAFYQQEVINPGTD